MVVGETFTSYHEVRPALPARSVDVSSECRHRVPHAKGGAVPLSEHEQRMLEQIESALYAEDPKFASSVKHRRLGRGGSGGGRRRLQAVAVFVVGLVLLIGGLAIDVKVGGFPILSLIGFLVMFGACLMALWAGPRRSVVKSATGARSAQQQSAGARRKLSERMEERFNRRFDQDR